MCAPKLVKFTGGTVAAEYAEVRKRLAALLEKAEQVAKGLNCAGLNLSPNSENGPPEALDVSHAPWLHALNEQPTTQEIQDLADQIRAATARKRELEAALWALGIDPEK